MRVPQYIYRKWLQPQQAAAVLQCHKFGFYNKYHRPVVMIMPSGYQAQKTRKYKSRIGRIGNIKYHREEDCFIYAEDLKPYS